MRGWRKYQYVAPDGFTIVIPYVMLWSFDAKNIDDVDLSEMVIGNRIKSVEHFEIETQVQLLRHTFPRRYSFANV